MAHYHLHYPTTNVAKQCRGCASVSFISTSDGDLVCKDCGIVNRARMLATTYTNRLYVNTAAQGSTVGSSVINSRAKYHDDEGRYVSSLQQNNHTAKKISNVNKGIHKTERIDDLSDRTNFFVDKLNVEASRHSANNIITLWNKKKGNKSTDAFRSRLCASLSAVILASRLKMQSLSLRLVAVETRLDLQTKKKVGRYVREMDRYLKETYQFVVPTTNGFHLSLRWASVLHKHGCDFFLVHSAGINFLRGIIRRCSFNEMEIASSPDIVAGTLLWLCSAILRYPKPFTKVELKVVCSAIPLRRSVNRLLAMQAFLRELSIHELPPEFSDIVTSLEDAHIDAHLSFTGKKKSKNCSKNRA